MLSKISQKRCQLTPMLYTVPKANIWLHTYNSVLYGGKERRIWHIHGEARKPDSMILGHYYYGNLTAKIKNESDRLDDAYRREGYKCKSWMDLFILGDVYIIGTALDVSEIDLWWLINRKARETAAVERPFSMISTAMPPASGMYRTNCWICLTQMWSHIMSGIIISVQPMTRLSPT
ncbi:AbiH family protein [Ruminococcus sp.]|uniref:AbiH family protein n=1 Tax=Ruminococcus sp. TaxID=41978 RepID=UPI0025D8A964|nr:AbiH family protein [Ruminococcus sp.]MBR1433065.1 hypothetical protein [Ruminococcus sp.]